MDNICSICGKEWPEGVLSTRHDDLRHRYLPRAWHEEHDPKLTPYEEGRKVAEDILAKIRREENLG